MKSIILTTPEIIALKEGRKSQFRVPLNPQPETFHACSLAESGFSSFTDSDCGYACRQIKLPYKLGEPIFVKEAIDAKFDCDSFYVADEVPLTEVLGWGIWHEDNRTLPVKLISAYHMPEWASRFIIIPTSVKIQRLQDISEEDAIAEGISRPNGHTKYWQRYDAKERGAITEGCLSPIVSFSTLHDLKYAKKGHGWEKNDYVFAYTFEHKEG